METEEVNAELTVTSAEPIKADVDVLKFVNLALVQNGLPALQDLRVTNETDELMKDVVCAFSSDDGFIVPNQKAFKEIEAHGSVGSHNVDVLLNQRRIVEYAPDEHGKFTMSFGPLNLSGGERRLNVAVTRAKEQVIVFSSIHGSQIDAGEGGRTKAVGAGHLISHMMIPVTLFS